MEQAIIQHENKARQKSRIFTSSGIVSVCGIVYQVLYGAAGSYLFGNSTLFYCLTIGFFLSGMGIGAYISEWFKKELLSTFVYTEYLIALIGGFSITGVFFMQAYFGDDLAKLFLYVVIIITGILTGLELPLLIRKSEEIDANLQHSTAKVLFFDYAGSLIGTVAFAFLLRPWLGLIQTAFFISIINILVAIWLSFVFKKEMNHRLHRTIGFTVLVLLVFGLLFGEKYAAGLEQKLYRDPIIFQEDTEYQRIVMTKRPGDLRLFLDGQLQFAESDEYRYHEGLVHIPMSLASERDSVLILGGGDGLAVRELLKYNDVKKITVVDLDPAMIDLAKNNALLRKLNEQAFSNPLVKIKNKDAFSYLKNSTETYDVIIIDLPDPNNEALNKLYTWEFYSLVRNALTPEGITSIQSTSPVFAREAFWTINETVKHVGLQTAGYHIDVPSFGNWGFTLASRAQIDTTKIDITVETSYLTNSLVPALFQFGKDEDDSFEKELKPNSLNRPILLDYYEKAWKYY